MTTKRKKKVLPVRQSKRKVIAKVELPKAGVVRVITPAGIVPVKVVPVKPPHKEQSWWDFLFGTE